MKYKIINKKDKTVKIVEARKKPINVDESIYTIKRLREKPEPILTSNQKHRARRKARNEKS